jgi:hypothetical protein
MMGRMIRSHTKRVAAGNLTDLADLVALRAELDAAITAGAQGLHAERDGQQGHSWTEIAGVLGISRQAARQRFGTVDGGAE